MRNRTLYTIALLFAALQTFAQTTYTYDKLNRLTEVRYGNGATVTYTYDALGNRLSKKVTGGISKREAYAWLSSDGKTLTFCYDNQKDERTGDTFDLNTGKSYPGWNPDPWSTVNSVTKVVFNPAFAEVRPTCMYVWFCNFQNLTEIIGLDYLNTSEVTDMYSSFRDCWSLETLDLRHFDTSKVTEMGYMFYHCKSMTSLDVSSFDTSNVSDMDRMFGDCCNLTNLDVSSFNTSKVKYFTCMFEDCSSLTSLDVSNFDISNLRYSYSMFEDCCSLESLEISAAMGIIDDGACNGVGTSSSPCDIIAPEGFDFGVDTSGSYFEWKSGYFKLGNQKEVYAWLSSDGKTLTFCYDGKRGDRIGSTYDLSSDEYTPPGWFTDFDEESAISEVVFDSSFANATPIYTSYWFVNMVGLTEIKGLNYLNTSNVRSMYNMFHGCSGLTSLDLSHFDTSSVTSMGQMFDGCSALKSLDLSSFDTSNVIDMGFMFYNCSSLESIEISSFNLSNVIQTHYMFWKCSSLKNLDLSNFDTSGVTSSVAMLAYCSSLKNLCISSSMGNLSNDACMGVGESYNPCSLTAPQGFDFGVDTSASCFVWKSGIFKLNNLSGDVNSDGKTTIADITALVNIIQGKDNTLPYLYDHDSADVNHDGSITFADVTELVNIILGK